MKYDMTTVVLNLYAKPMETADETASDAEKKEGKTRDLLLRDVIVEALMAPDNADRGRTLKGSEKLQRYALGQRVMKEDSLALTAEEITTISADVAYAYPPIFCGRVAEVLDPASVGIVDEDASDTPDLKVEE